MCRAEPRRKIQFYFAISPQKYFSPSLPTFLISFHVHILHMRYLKFIRSFSLSRQGEICNFVGNIGLNKRFNISDMLLKISF